MTREEAIKCLTSFVGIRRKYCDMQTMKDEIECLEIAIEVLEQDLSEDAVSREKVKEQMIKYGFHAPDMTVTEFVEDLPSVNPQLKTGHWIISPNDCFATCSECGLSGDKGIFKHYRWCPICGAKMSEIPTGSEKERKEEK